MFLASSEDRIAAMPALRAQRGPDMTKTAATTVTPYLVADLLAGGVRMPVNVHVIDHPDARILIDTGIRALHPAAQT